MLNLHPILVHFPIALFISSLGLEIASYLARKESLHKTAFHIYILAACLAPLAVLTGLQQANIYNLHHPVFYLHRNFGFLASGISLISLPVFWVLSRKNPPLVRIVFLLFQVTVVGCVIVAGFEGGRMVYEYGVGVSQ